VLGALVAAKLLPGRGAAEVQLASEPAGETDPDVAPDVDRHFDPDRYPEYVPYVSA